MFMLKSLFGKIWGDANTQELIQIPAGALYLVRPNGPQGSRECIYEDAVLSIRRTTTDFHYQLVVTKAFQDSQPELVDQEEDDLEDERAFLIDQALDFRLSTRGKERTIVWRDFDGDEQDLLEFVVDGKQVNEVTVTIFEITFMQCVYEHAFRTSHERATEEDLDKLRYKDPTDPELKREQKSASKIEDASVASRNASAPAAASSAPASTSQQDTKPTLPPATVAPAVDNDGPQVDENNVAFSTVADLYLFDTSTGFFLKQEQKVVVQVLEAGRFLFWLHISGKDRPWLAQKVDNEMGMSFSSEQTSAVWNYFTDDRSAYSWLLRFGEPESFNEFQRNFSRVLYETLNEEPFAKVKTEDKAYVEATYEQDEPMDIDEVSESEGGDLSVRTAREEEEEEEDEEEVAKALRGGRDDTEEAAWPEDDASSLIPGKPDANSLLAVGYKFDRSFVSRGDKIGVFRHTDHGLEFDTAINKVGTPSGKGFKPLKMMLHNQDAQMVMMDPANQHAVFNMDLEYGKIVDEWKVHDDVQVQNVVPNSKYAQMTAEQTLIGHSHNGIYRIDPRLAGNKMVDSQFKQYASKNDFSAAATDANGNLAVASNKGDVRLFDSIGKNAKTVLPSNGAGIIGVDITSDGRYIILTCKTHLYLIDNLIGSGRNSGALGFNKSFPADSKPIPKTLKLSPAHVAYMGAPVSFTPARFNTGMDQETSIVTSTGPYVVSWSFNDVKKGKLNSYVLKRYGSVVIGDQHTYGSDQSIVVAFEQDVQMAKRSQLVKPTRKSLAPAALGRKSGA